LLKNKILVNNIIGMNFEVIYTLQSFSYLLIFLFLLTV